GPIGAVIAACTSADRPPTGSPGGSQAKGRTSLGSNYSDPLPKAALAALIEQFTAETGIDVDVNTIDSGSFQDGIGAYLQGRPDDVFTWFAGNRMRFFAGHGLAAPISDVWPTIKDRFSDGVQRAAIGDDGKPYLVPFQTYPWAVVHRRSIWQQRGYDVPATFDDLISLAERMRADGLVPLAFGDKDGWPAMGTFDILDLRLNGYDFHLRLATGTERWTDRRVRDVFDAWRRLLPFQQQAALSRTWQDAARSMIAGESGMYYAGTFAGEQTDEAGRADLALFPFPTLGTAFDGERALDAPINGFMLSRQPKDAAAANAFLRFVAGGPAQTTYVTRNPNRIAVASDADPSGYSAYQKEMASLIKGAGRLAQFFDRDSRPDFTGPTGLQAFLQDFLTDPSQQLDPYLARIQAFWDSLV
ncbi:MAG: multiple sugar transport system substrate-binding protein, partial [Chloroflexota bacterium]|nr:multiple sugar transport system substrate-binding protein [Chloroflexota bacterium]